MGRIPLGLFFALLVVSLAARYTLQPQYILCGLPLDIKASLLLSMSVHAAIASCTTSDRAAKATSLATCAIAVATVAGDTFLCVLTGVRLHLEVIQHTFEQFYRYQLNT